MTTGDCKSVTFHVLYYFELSKQITFGAMVSHPTSRMYRFDRKDWSYSLEDITELGFTLGSPIK